MNVEAKTAYQEKMEAKLMKIKADMKYLEASLKEKKADAQIAAQLQEQWDLVNAKLQKLKTGSSIAWQETQDGVANAWIELQSAFKKASDKIKHQ